MPRSKEEEKRFLAKISEEAGKKLQEDVDATKAALEAIVTGAKSEDE